MAFIASIMGAPGTTVIDRCAYYYDFGNLTGGGLEEDKTLDKRRILVNLLAGDATTGQYIYIHRHC